MMDKEKNLRLASRHGDIEEVKRLVKEGADPNRCDLHGNTPLHLACLNGHLNVVTYLSAPEICSNIEKRGWKGFTLVHLAVLKGHIEILRYLVEQRKCDVNSVAETTGTTPFHVASYAGNLDVVQYLSDNELCDINAKDNDGRNALHIAAEEDHLEVVKYLIEGKGCDMNLSDENNVTPLHLACSNGHLNIVTYLSSPNMCSTLEASKQHTELLKHLVEQKKCDVNSTDKTTGVTPLHVACSTGHLDVVKYLSRKELCDINTKDRNGRHGLHFAAEQGHLAIVKHLVERKGCNVNLMDGNNDTPLHLACSNVPFSEHDTDTGHLDTVKYLISNALCDVNAKDGKGRTVAHLAAKSGSFDVLKILFDRGYLFTGDIDDNIPLHYACSRKGCSSLDNASNINLIKFLVSQPDCNIDEVNKDGEHVLHILCKYDSDPNIIKYLISEKQCCVNVFDSHGNHPLHLACKALNIEHVIALTSSPNCDVDVINHLDGQHPLHILCEPKANNIAVEIADHLIKKKQCNLNICNENGYTPLGLACKACNLEMVKLLTDETRCNINEGIHPLLIAYQNVKEYWDWKDGFDLLMNKPSCDVNVQDSDGNTLLHLACKGGYTSMVEPLICHPKCDINKLNNNNKTPLLLATRAQRNWTNEIVKLLMKTNKCDVNIRDIGGNSPLHYVCEWSNKYFLPSVMSLTDSPVCDINAENNEGVRPIHLATKRGNLQVVYHLVNCGCDAAPKDKSGKTPMDYSTSTKVKDFLSNVVYGTPYIPGNSKGELYFIQHSYTFILYFITDEARLYHNIKRYQALRQDGYTRLKVTKCILTGPPGAGKSTLKKRLLNESLGDDSSTGVVNAAVQVDSFRKIDQQGVVVPNINEDSNLEWRKQDVDEEAVFVMNTIAEPISNITDSENDETSSTDSENDEGSHDLVSVSGDAEDHQKISQNDEISTPVIHKRTEVYELSVKTPPATVEWMEEAIEDHRSPSNCGEHESQSEIDETIKPIEVKSHLHETLEQDSTTHDDDLKTKAINEISKSVEKISYKKKQQYISNIQNIDKDNHAVLQIIDTGGQPEFHEMLPALITGPAVNLLVFKLTEELQGRYPITYRSSDGNSEPYLTSLTHEEVIFRSLSSIACLRYNTVGWRFDHDEVPVKDDSEPAAFLIASHRDCVVDEKVDTVNDHLKQRIQSSAELFGENLIQFSAPDKPVFALDTTKDQKEIEDLRKSLHSVINTKFQDIKVPVSWCALSLKLKRRNQSLYTYQTCFKLAKESGIKDEDDFKAVLWFLHNRAGTIMYYPDVEGLEDIIITNIQLVFDRITELMTSCFTFKNLGPSAEKVFHSMGMFTECDIRELSKRKGDPLTPKRLVALLKYLHIVAGPLKSKVGRSTKISYFMPCALKPAKIENEHRNETSTPAPLLIWFECGYCPVGVYCCLVVYLLSLSQQTEFKWELANPPHYRNKITFTVNKQYDRVTILSRATYIEVWVDQAQEFEDPVRLKTLCQNVRSVLDQGIDAVTQTLHYSYNSRHYFGFPCCSSSSSCQSLPPHSAVCEYEEPVAAKCVLNKVTMKLKDNHSIWFQLVCFKL